MSHQRNRSKPAARSVSAAVRRVFDPPKLSHPRAAPAETANVNHDDQVQRARRLGHRVQRLVASPSPSAGRGVRLIQPKLTLGPVGDSYEQEADSVARQVTAQLSASPQVNPSSEASTARRAPEAVTEEPETARMQPELMDEELTARMQPELMDEELTARMQPELMDEELTARMQPELMDEELTARMQRHSGGSAQRQESEPRDGAVLDAQIESSIDQARSGGRPLGAIRGPMEGAFGADFSSVRVHTDMGADALNRSLQARAFTTGQDIFFRQGEYSPGTSGGNELLAHELTHVVQQNADVVQDSDAE